MEGGKLSLGAGASLFPVRLPRRSLTLATIATQLGFRRLSLTKHHQHLSGILAVTLLGSLSSSLRFRWTNRYHMYYYYHASPDS
jgi:hypothetical protein